MFQRGYQQLRGWDLARANGKVSRIPQLLRAFRDPDDHRGLAPTVAHSRLKSSEAFAIGRLYKLRPTTETIPSTDGFNKLA
jgi:hypothetical protein